MLGFSRTILRYLVICSLLFVSGLSKAQAVIGVVGGINQATFVQVENSLLSPVKSFNSFQGGIFIREATQKGFNVGLELNYRRKTDNLEVFNSTGLAYANELVGKFKLDYCSLLFLPEVDFGKKLRGFVNVGPYFGWLVNSSFVGNDISYSSISPHPPLYNVSEIPTGYFPKYDWGFAASAGVKRSFKEIYQVTLTLRYYMSFPSGDFRSNDLGFLLSISRTTRKKIFNF